MAIIPQTRGQAYKRLRFAIKGRGYKIGPFVHRITKISNSAIDQRMAAKQPWKLSEMYKLMDALEIPHDQLYKIFPADPYEEVIAWK